MRIANGLYKAVKIDWSNVTLPLKEGTPISKAGAVANTSSALGIVPQTVTQIPLIPELYILVGGDVELAEVNASYGSSLTADAKAAMSAIRFWTEDGPDDSADAVGISDNGVFIVEQLVDGEMLQLSEKHEDIQNAWIAGKSVFFRGWYEETSGSGDTLDVTTVCFCWPMASCEHTHDHYGVDSYCVGFMNGNAIVHYVASTPTEIPELDV